MIRVLLIVAAVVLWAHLAAAASVTLQWDPNDPTPGGYRVFTRGPTEAYNYLFPAWDGQETTCTIENLPDDEVTYFVVRAYAGSLESADSEEVFYTPNGDTNISVKLSESGSWELKELKTYVGTTDQEITVVWPSDTSSEYYRVSLKHVERDSLITIAQSTPGNQLSFRLPRSGHFIILVESCNQSVCSDWYTSINAGWWIYRYVAPPGPIVIGGQR